MRPDCCRPFCFAGFPACASALTLGGVPVVACTFALTGDGVPAVGSSLLLLASLRLLASQLLKVCFLPYVFTVLNSLQFLMFLLLLAPCCCCLLSFLLLLVFMLFASVLLLLLSLFLIASLLIPISLLQWYPYVPYSNPKTY
jgi:hypothetical protein